MVTKANTLGSLAIPLADLTSSGGDGVNRPASGVSWNEAARFVNWLNTSSGSTPAYKFALQPGEVATTRMPISNCGRQATPATTRAISTATAWRYFCPATMNGTRRRSTIRPAASITTIRRAVTAYPRPCRAALRRRAQRCTVRLLVLALRTLRWPGYESLRHDGPGGQCLGMGRDRLRSGER